MKRLLRYSTLILAFALTSCDREANGPSDEALKKQLAVQLPGFLSVHSFSIAASENAGTKVEPVFKHRFKAEVEALEDTFRDAGNLDSHLLVVRECTKGDRRPLYGVATSVRHGESWAIQYTFEDDPIPSIGRPRTSYPATTITKGSPEEEQLRRDLQRRIAEQEKARQEQERLNTERERRKAEQRAAFKMPQSGESVSFAFTVYPNEWSEPLPMPTNYNFVDSADAPNGTRYFAMVDDDKNRVYLCRKGTNVDFGNYVSSVRFKSGETSPVKITMKFTPMK